MRKTYIKYILPVMLGLLAWSCTEESNLEPEGQWTLSSPAIVAPASGAAVVLNQSTPNATINFEWTAASSSVGYGITYSIVIDTLGSENFDTPIIEVKSANAGKALNGAIAYNLLDEALSLAGYPANLVAKVSWAIKANCLSKKSLATGTLSVTRFAAEIIPAELFLSGEATEKGTNLAQAIPFKKMNGAGGALTNKFEVYTSLLADKPYKFYSAKSLPAHQYGGSDTILVKSGKPITTKTSGVYRISVDLDNMTCSLLKIDRMGVIGDSFSTSWNSDVVLDYQGGGVWKGTVEVVAKKDFIFRANNSWSYLFKRVKGTTNKAIMEAQATIEGAQVENIPTDKIGSKIFTLDLSAGAYTYLIEKDPNAPASITTPSTLFLLANGQKIQEFTKDGDTFTSPVYLALQGSVAYTLNSAADGSGTSYLVDSNIGATTTLGGDKVSGLSNVTQDAGTIAVQYDQAYKLSIDFAATKLSWSYYNLKLFHWNNWDTRNEYAMTYVHPYKFTLIGAALEAGYEMKFNSPWDVQFGAVSPADNIMALSGTTTNSGSSSNFKCIQTSGSYDVTITTDNMFQFGTYSFVAH